MVGRSHRSEVMMIMISSSYFPSHMAEGGGETLEGENVRAGSQMAPVKKSAAVAFSAWRDFDPSHPCHES